MALNAQSLAALITNRTNARMAGIDPTNPESAEAIDRESTLALAEAIVEHILGNLEILPGIPVATAGSPAAQTGVTTGPGVIL